MFMKVLDTVSTILKQKGQELWWIAPEATVYEALELVADKAIGALVVMQEGKPVGILSERDFARKVVLKGKSSRDTKVSEIMNSPAITVDVNCSVDEAMLVMTEHHIRHLPVVDASGVVVGVVSIGDLVKWTISSHEKTIQHLHSYIAGVPDTSSHPSSPLPAPKC
jgi:signal-transduction protein with cAMP-binding, CBS, and nucleotidyltransferase domain